MVRQSITAVIPHKFHLFILKQFQLNDSIQARYTVKRGANNIYDIGRVIAVNNERMLNVFKEDEKCNLYNGTDKSLFEPFQRKDKIIWAYAHDACKSFPLRFKYRKTIRHIKTAFKSAYFTDPLVKTLNLKIILLFQVQCSRYILPVIATNILDVLSQGQLTYTLA